MKPLALSLTGVALALVASLSHAGRGTALHRSPAAPQTTAIVLVGAGDIAACGSTGDEATAALLDSLVQDTLPVIVFTSGDNAYSDGTAAQFHDCYDPTWGRQRARTRPAPGNHDYRTSQGSAYFDYFGAAAGDRARGYYSFDSGPAHVVVLNSNVSMKTGSPQEQWLRADLAASDRPCTIAIWHVPRFSSGTHHGSSTRPAALWNALYQAGADLAINGHEHNYERFAPQNPSGEPDSARGLREIVVGTGGADHYGFAAPLATSEVRNGTTFGVLKVTVQEARYSWKFVPVAGETFSDSGDAACH